MTKQKISIDENDIWAGTGDLLYTPEKGGHYFVSNCPAELGANSAESDAAYDAIDAAINDGETSVTIGEYTWTWEIIEDDEDDGVSLADI